MAQVSRDGHVKQSRAADELARAGELRTLLYKLDKSRAAAYTTKAAAEAMGISVSTVLYQIEHGYLYAEKIGGSWSIPKYAIHDRLRKMCDEKLKTSRIVCLETLEQ